MTPQPKALLWVAVSTINQADDEKASLPSQEADLKAIAAERGWRVIDVLRVPGHSRRYKDINKCAADMLRAGIDAYAKLLRYFDEGGFDVLLVRDGSRFARTQALHSYVTESVIDAGAMIYSIADGQIDETNYRMWAAFSGFSSSTEIDNLKKRHKMGMAKRYELQKPMASKDTWTHRKVRNAAGKSVTYEVREDTRALWNIVADDLLTGISYRLIANRLADVHKIRKPNGTPFYDSNIHQILLNPITWGHIARGNGGKWGIWAFDETAPLPDGVTITRNTHPPLWTGVRAQLIQAELRRRSETALGRAWASRLTMFSGCVYCYYCGGRMTYHIDPDSGWRAYVCDRRYLRKTRTPASDRRPCASTKKSIRLELVIDWLKPLIQKVIDTGSIAALVSTPADEDGQRIPALQRELDTLESAILKLTLEKINTPTDSQYLIQKLLDQSHERLSVVKASIQAIQRDTLMQTHSVASAATGVARLRAYKNADEFMAAPHTVINQIMLMLLGSQRIVVKDGAIAGIAYPPPKADVDG